MTHNALGSLGENVVKSWIQKRDLDPYTPAQDRIVRNWIRRLAEKRCGSDRSQLDDICQEVLIRISSSLRSWKEDPEHDSVARFWGIVKFHVSSVTSVVLMRSGKPMRRDFGLIVSETEVEHTNSGSRTGVKVKDVLPGSAADRAGIMKKDVIVEIDGATIATKEQFRTAMRSELSKSGFRLTLQRAEDEYSYATLFSADRHHDYTYRETTLDVSEIPHVEGMSEEATLLSVLAARTVLGRMKNKKAKRAFELHYLDGLSYSQMVELDKDYFRNENNCCVLAKRGFKEAAFLLEEYASELLKHWSTVLTKEQRTIYRGICEEARQLVKRFEKY